MLRLVGFFFLVLFGVSFLRQLPWVGHLFGSFFSFWIVAILLSLSLSKLAVVATRRRRLSGDLRRLGEVESPHNQGKLGSLLLAYGRAREAIQPLRKAVEGEPEVAEWHYRLGCALIESRSAPEAIRSLEAAARIDEEHAYGGVQLVLSDALLAVGDEQTALAALAIFERNHGPNPASAYRRGRALRALGRRDEARAAFDEVARLARAAARFKRAENRTWVLKAWLARLF